jgi:hypothetical protein
MTGELRPMTANVLMLLGVVLSLVFAAGLWRMRPVRPAACVLAAARTANINAKLRLEALNLTPEEMGIAVPDTGGGVWGAVADMAFPNGTAIVVAFSDGSATLYWGDTGRPIPCSAIEPLRQAARSAVAAMEACSSELRPRGIQALPRPGHVRLHALTRRGLLSSDELSVHDLSRRDDALSLCYREVDHLLTAFRRTVPRPAVRGASASYAG